MMKQDVMDMAAKLFGELTRLGYEYDWAGDNRSKHKSIYVFVRRPRYMEIRISDHPMNKIKRRKTFDIGPQGISLDQAIKEISDWSPPQEAERT